MTKMEFVRIKVTGKDVQGVTLREIIKEKADELKIKGFVKNVRDGSNHVEVICQNCKEIDEFIKRIKSLSGEVVKIDNVEKQENVFDEALFRDFKVQREDDLHEMVWALQGAGKLFAGTEKRRVKGLINGLIYELDSISDKASSFDVSTFNGFSLECLNNFLIQCPIYDQEELIRGIQELKERCMRVNASLSSKTIAEIGKEEIPKIRESVPRIVDALKTIGTMM